MVARSSGFVKCVVFGGNANNMTLFSAASLIVAGQ